MYSIYLRGQFGTVSFKQNYFIKFIQFNFQIIFKYDIFPLEIASLQCLFLIFTGNQGLQNKI